MALGPQNHRTGPIREETTAGWLVADVDANVPREKYCRLVTLDKQM
jgi:hypothetical protein